MFVAKSSRGFFVEAMMFRAAMWKIERVRRDELATSFSSVTVPWTNWAADGIVSAWPVNRSSRTVTLAPASTSRLTTAPPTKPAPPVTRIAAPAEASAPGPIIA